MIRFKQTTFQYSQGEVSGGVFDIDLHIHPGEMILLCGESGCGKTTLTRMINGLVPHYYEGTMDGEVYVGDIDVKGSSLYDLSGVVGSVFQNPRTQFFTLDSTDEIAFGCENLGISPGEIRRRIGNIGRELRLQSLLGRSLFVLSGGEKQKIACGSIAAMEPNIYVLDEPSSNLDIRSINEFRQLIAGWKEQGKTIVAAEHRLNYLLDIADRIVYMKKGRIEEIYTTDEFRKRSEEELHKMGLRCSSPSLFEDFSGGKLNTDMIEISDFQVTYKKSPSLPVLSIPELKIPKNAVVGIIGNNGAGKSTFANNLCGLLKKSTGTLRIGQKSLKGKQRIHSGYLVMQDVNHQLFTESVEEEILLSLPREEQTMQQKELETILRDMNLQMYRNCHPMSLSGGQKQRVAIAGALAARRDIIVFDEPTSGLDYRHMQEVAINIRRLQEDGKSIFIITHDPELLRECCNYFIFMEQGRVAWHGGVSEENIVLLRKFFYGEEL